MIQKLKEKFGFQNLKKKFGNWRILQKAPKQPGLSSEEAARRADRGWPSRIWSEPDGGSELPPACYSGPSGEDFQHDVGSGSGGLDE